VIPSVIPASFLAVRGSSAHPAATSAANSAVVEFRMEVREAVRLMAAMPMSEKGTAALSVPSTKKCLQRPLSLSRRPGTNA
jgi:hypothetical protein